MKKKTKRVDVENDELYKMNYNGELQKKRKVIKQDISVHQCTPKDQKHSTLHR